MDKKEYTVHCVQIWRIPYTVSVTASDDQEALSEALEASRDEPFDWDAAALQDTELTILEVI